MQAAIALYKACGYQEESQEAVNDMPRNGGSLLGEASNQAHFRVIQCNKHECESAFCTLQGKRMTTLSM